MKHTDSNAAGSMGNDAMAETTASKFQLERGSLERRHARPRLVLWIGINPSPDLLGDLPRLPVATCFAYAGVDEMERALRKGCDEHRVPFLRVDEREHLEAFDPLSCTLVSLAALEQVDHMSGGPRRRLKSYEHDALDLVDDLRSERPLHIAIGMTSPRLRAIIERLTDFDPGAPLWLVGGEPCPELDPEMAASVRIQAQFESWGDLREWFSSRSHPLLRGELADVAIRVGDARVPLRDLFVDDYLRIDRQWRLITTRGLVPEARSRTDRFELFRRYMLPDETTDAATAEEDFWEWWAIAEGIPVPRNQEGVAWHWRDVESALQDTEGREEGAQALRVVWLPAEPASGSTKITHQIAFEAARAGYPALVLKQEVTDQLQPDAVIRFLLALGELAAASTTNRALSGRPALIVVDHQHYRLDGVRKLQSLLARHRKPCVFLVVRRPPGRSLAGQELKAEIEADGVDLYGEHEATVLPVLHSKVRKRDVDDFRRHADRLRQADRIPLPERSEEAWGELRDHRRAVAERIAWHLGMRPHERDNFITSASGTPVFWEVIGHFLAGRDEDPLGAWFRNRLEYVRLDLRARAVLLEVAKAALCDLAVPVRALADWLAEHPGLTGALVQNAEPVEELDLERLRATWATRPNLFTEPERVPDRLRSMLELLDGLEEHGWIRRFVDPAGDEWVAAQFTSNMARSLLGAYQTVAGNEALPWDAFEVDVEQDGHRLIGELTATLRPHRANLVFAHMVSEHLYKGHDDGAYWGQGRGEARLEAYSKLNRELLETSRVLQHHKAMVARRTTFSNGLDRDTKLARLEEALSLLERALKLPGGEKGHRDEHPGHLLTTLALVLDELAHLTPDRAIELRREARERLEEALLLVHGSPHTRQKLAELLRRMASRLIASARTHGTDANRDLELEITDTIARGLQLLSWNPPRHETHLSRWRAEREKLAHLGGDRLVAKMVAHLCERGDEHGFLLRAELMALEQGELPAASFLRGVLEKYGVEAFPRAALRCAELLREDLSGAWEERFVLLSAVEVLQGPRLEPLHGFELGFLAFQTGRYDEGGRRFKRLRASGRARQLFLEGSYYLWETAGTKPRRFKGRVQTTDPGNAWISVLDSATGQRLFQAPFNPYHFEGEGLRPRMEVPVYVRFTATGAKVVPVRFFRVPMRSRQAESTR